MIGVLGQDLTVTYTIASTFTEIKITIGTSLIEQSVIFNTHGKLNVDHLKDTRFSAQKLSPKSFSVTLANMTHADHNIAFTYHFKDENSKDWWNTRNLKVLTERDAVRMPQSSPDLIVIIVVAAAVIFVCIIIFILWKQGVLALCAERCCATGKKPGHATTKKHGGSVDDTRIYATPDTKVGGDEELQVKYSELGPGGRIEKTPCRLPKVEYAQVKVVEGDQEGDENAKLNQ